MAGVTERAQSDAPVIVSGPVVIPCQFCGERIVLDVEDGQPTVADVAAFLRQHEHCLHRD